MQMLGQYRMQINIVRSKPTFLEYWMILEPMKFRSGVAFKLNFRGLVDSEQRAERRQLERVIELICCKFSVEAGKIQPSWRLEVAIHREKQES